MVDREPPPEPNQERHEIFELQGVDAEWPEVQPTIVDWMAEVMTDLRREVTDLKAQVEDLKAQAEPTDMEGDWEAADFDTDLEMIAERDHGISPNVVKFFVRHIRRRGEAAEQAAVRADGEPRLADPAPRSELEEMWVVADELADASGSWESFLPPATKTADEFRFDFAKLLWVSPLLVSAVLLTFVGLGVVTPTNAALLGGFMLTPLFTLLGIAVHHHFPSGVSEVQRQPATGNPNPESVS